MGQPATCDCGVCRKCYMRTYMQEYRKRKPQTTEQKEAAVERARQWARANRERYNESSREYRLRHPEKVAARSKLNDAIKLGKIERGDCEVCGRADAHAHHEDYSKPLDVRWLCSRHHTDEHQEMAA